MAEDVPFWTSVAVMLYFKVGNEWKEVLTPALCAEKYLPSLKHWTDPDRAEDPLHPFRPSEDVLRHLEEIKDILSE
jgi:hypothetical protein